MTAFPDPARFAALYPAQSGKVTHGMADHPLLTLDSLVGLAGRIDPGCVEYNRGDLPVGVAPDAVPGNGLSIADTIRSIEHNGSWMVLKFVERDPAYGALLDTTLGELDPIVGAATGPMLKREAFIFVSSPNSMTPFHFDPEHNILLQIRGTKAMTVFPANDHRLASAEEHERFHLGGHRNLPWRDEFAGVGTKVDLAPGEGIYVPVMAPHFVRNGPEVSISLSVTWRSGWSFRQADAHAFNATARRFGLSPRAPAPFPADNHAKSFAWRALRKAGVRAQ